MIWHEHFNTHNLISKIEMSQTKGKKHYFADSRNILAMRYETSMIFRGVKFHCGMQTKYTKI